MYEPSPLFTNNVILGKLLGTSKPQFPYLENGGNCQVPKIIAMTHEKLCVKYMAPNESTKNCGSFSYVIECGQYGPPF